jgi:hypothetical protein
VCQVSTGFITNTDTSKSGFLYFLRLKKITAISKVDKEEKQDEWKME